VVAIDFAADAGGVEDFDVAVHPVVHQPFRGASEPVHLRRARRKLQLAVTHEIAVDGLLPHDALDRVDRLVVGPIPRARALDTGSRRDVKIVDREPVVDVAAVAARGLSCDTRTGFEHNDSFAWERAAEQKDASPEALRMTPRTNRSGGVQGGISNGMPIDEYFRANLLRRETTVDDVARAFLFLASAEATTGCVITVDGGNAAAFPR
jgi:hypothetical protein